MEMWVRLLIMVFFFSGSSTEREAGSVCSLSPP
jgi:hypothetical protein